MLGGKEQIDRQLLELSERPRPDTLDTGSLRRLDPIGHAPVPLTYRQESLLVDWDRQSPPVYLALGSKALGIDDLAGSLLDLPAEDLAVQVKYYGTARQLEAGLADALRAAQAGRRNLAVLSGPWLGRAMVDEALAVTSIRKNGRRLRVLLLPQTVDWNAADGEQDGKLWGAEVLTLSPLGRTGLRQWLRAKDAPETAEAIDRLRVWTGGFASFIKALPPAAARAPFGDRSKAGAGLLSLSVSLGDLGLDDGRLLAAARVIVDFDVQDEHEQALIDMDVPNPGKALKHLEWLGVLERSLISERPLEVNPFVRRMLETAA
jgi:hypothetical protein